MIREHRHRPAYLLLELLFTLTLVALIVFVLGKLLLDGIYLQRIAGEYADRHAVTAALTKRLRADALGAVAYAWGEDAAGQTLSLTTYADGSQQQVRWLFRRDEVLRVAGGRDAGGFSAERLQFAARIERGQRFDRPLTEQVSVNDRLALDFIVLPPARAYGRSPRVFSEYVLLPRQAPGSTNTAEERQP